MSDVNIVWNVHVYNWIILLFYRFELLSSNIVFVLEERKAQSSLEKLMPNYETLLVKSLIHI